MILETLTFFARTRPHAVAIIDRVHGEMTYTEVERAVVGLSIALLSEIPDLPRLQPVGVAFSDKRLHLLLTFALEAIDVAILGFVQPSDPGLIGPLRQCKLVLGEHPPADWTGRFFALTSAWLDHQVARPLNEAFRPAVWGPDGVVSVLTTSGSTGSMKCIALQRRAFDAREANRIWQYGLSERSRYLVAMPICVGIVGMVVRAVLRVGGTLIFWDNDNPLLEALGITHTTLLPSHVQTYLSFTPPEFLPTSRIKLFSTGAPLSAALRDRAVARLGAEVKNSYGTNETGTCAWFGNNGDGEMLPGVDVDIVDEALQSVPKGVPGRIRIRSLENARGYLDLKLTRERFSDGWFLSDDIGVMRDARHFALVGRTDTIINIGGVKLVPEEIEESLAQRGLARDLAVCTLPNKDGLEELYIVLVQPLMEHATIPDRISESLGPNFGHIKIVLSEQVPRNAQGKIQRKALRDRTAAQLARR